MTREQILEKALMAVIDASGDYLPPDGISKDDFINRVLSATDNAEIFQALKDPAPGSRTPLDLSPNELNTLATDAFRGAAQGAVNAAAYWKERHDAVLQKHIECCGAPAQQPSGAIPTRNEQIVHGAVDRGNAQYWADSRRQEAAFKEWEAAGYEGDCRQCLNGSVVDYITRAIMGLSEPSKKMLEGASPVSSTQSEAGK